MKKCALLGLALGLLSCQTPGSLDSQASGQFAVRLLWPAPTFRVQVIPPATETLHLKIFQGSTVELDETLSREQSGERLLYTLPVGQKTVEVQALDATGALLADSRTALTIRQNQLTRATLDLIPVDGPAGASSGTSGTETPAAIPSTSPSASVNPSGADAQSPADKPTDPTPQSSSEPAPQTSPQPSASPTAQTGSRSGGSSGSSAAVNPVLDALLADPSTLSGDAFVARLQATVSDPDEVLQASDYVWSCVDNDANPCAAPQPSASDPNLAYWTAPDPANTGPYLLTLTLTPGSGSTSSQSVTIAVEQGTQNVNSDQVEFNSGGQ